MRRIFKTSSFLILFLALAGTAQDGPAGSSSPAAANAAGHIRAAALRAHMAFLADDLLEGRGPATRGYDIAARYVAAQLETIGLEPGAGNGWFQQVPMQLSDLIAEETAIEIVSSKGERRKLAFGADYLAGGEFQESAEVEAPVVFVGYGVTAPERGIDDYAGVDVKGKIIAYFAGAPPSFPPEEQAHFSSTPTKAGNAAAHGAAGTLRLWSDEDEKGGSWNSFVQLLGTIGRFAWLDGDTAHGYWPPDLVGAGLGPAASRSLFEGAGVTYADAQARPVAVELPARVRIMKKSRLTALRSANVVGLLRGSDPALADEYVVFSAHLDHLGISAPVNGDSIYNGAVDNASGIASLIEVARAFAAMPQRPRRSLLFVAFTAEESGLIGSDFFVNNPPVPLESIAANLNFDGGTMWPFEAVFARGADHSALAGAVKAGAAAAGVPVVADPFPEQAGLVRSDQYSFIRKGVPAAIFGAARTEAARPVVLDWVRNRYHQPSDDMAQPLDFDAAARFTRVLFLIGHAAAQADERPRWNPGDFFGERFGTAATKKAR